MTIGEKAAIEALKPAAGFIDALLGPKIKHLKDYLHKKNISKSVKPEAVEQLLREYYVSLSYKVSEITSLAFPDRTVNLLSTYEPLQVGRHYWQSRKWLPISIDDLLNGKDTNFLLVDCAGMGKSTFAKYLVSQCLLKSNDIPVLVELRKLHSEITLIGYIAKQFDSLGFQLDREIFYALLKLGKFYIVLDGFDEIPIKRQSSFANEISDLTTSAYKNRFLVTSRDQTLLPKLSQGLTMVFSEFSRNQSEALICRYDQISNNNIAPKLIKQLDTAPNQLTDTPLLVSLLYRTFQVNRTIADRMSAFYDEIYQAFYKGHDLVNKDGHERELKSGLDFTDFKLLLMNLCFRMVSLGVFSFDSDSSAEKFIRKSIKTPSTLECKPAAILDDLLVAVPLMHRDGNELKFLHKTIPEYFCSEYIIFDNSSASLLEKIYKSTRAFAFQKAFEFVLDSKRELFDEVITSTVATKAKNLNLTHDYATRILATLELLSPCHIGIFDGDFDLSNHTNRFKFEINIGNKIYKIVFTLQRDSHFYKGIDSLALRRISSPIKERKNEYADQCFTVSEIGNLNKLVKLSKKNIERFAKSEVLVSRALEVCRRGSSYFTSSGHQIHALCPEKVEKIIENSKCNAKLRAEVSAFFD